VGTLVRGEQQRFLNKVTNPAPEDSKGVLGAQELAESRQELWWVSEAVYEGEVPAIKPTP
jgi:hypothetical protein